MVIVGAKGQIGAELVRRSAVRPLAAFARADLDIGDAAAVRAVLARVQPRVVINAAAYTAVDDAEREPERAWAVNRDGAGHLAEACAAAGIPLFHLSSDYVFDGRQTRPYREDDATSPIGVYGASKQAGEDAVRRHLAQHLILRTSWVFGAYGRNFVKAILNQAMQRSELRVVADQFGAPTYAGAIAESVLQLADRHLRGERLIWGTYHYSGQPLTQWCAFAEIICAEAFAAGLLTEIPVIRAISSADYPGAVARPAYSALDVTKAGRDLQLDSQPWIRGLRETLRNWRDAS